MKDKPRLGSIGKGASRCLKFLGGEDSPPPTSFLSPGTVTSAVPALRPPEWSAPARPISGHRPRWTLLAGLALFLPLVPESRGDPQSTWISGPPGGV